MVRHYERKTQRGADGENYTREQLNFALQDVKNGNKTVYGAAAFYHIPRTTLRHYINGTRGKGIVSKAGKGGGGKLALDLEIEESLVTAINAMQKWGHGLSRDEVLDLLQSYIKINNVKTNFKDDRPGEEWFLNFCRRHRLSIKKPQGVELARKKQQNPWSIYGFFDILEKYVGDLNLGGKPHLIFNCDETSFSSDPSRTKIVGLVGSTCTRTISTPGRENTTVLVCGSASGEKLPLLAIFKGKNVMESWIPQDPEAVSRIAFAASKKGWMISKIFLNWFKKTFLPNIPEERPVLLIVDGHATHLSYELIQSAIENQVCILKLPPHTTHLLQPMDVGVFKSMKGRWDKALCKWQRCNPRKKIPKSTFIKLLNEEYSLMSSDNIINAFQATGIYVVDVAGPDRKKISPEIFNKSDLQRYENQRKNNVEPQEVFADMEPPMSPEVLPDREPLQSPEFLQDIEPLEFPEVLPNLEPRKFPEIQQELQLPELGPTKEQQEKSYHRGLQLNQLEVEPRPGCSKDTSDSTVSVSAPISNKIGQSFEDLILNLLGRQKEPVEQPLKKRRRICNGSEVITTIEYLELKKVEEEKKRTKENQKQSKGKGKQPPPFKKNKKPKYQSDSSSEELSEEDENIEESEEDTENVLTVIEGDFVIVNYNGILYPGKVLALKKDQVEVSHMIKSGLFAWRWPDKPDVLLYHESEIRNIIGKPQQHNNRGSYLVPEMDKFN